MFNLTWSKYTNGKNFKTINNHSDNHISSDSWIPSRFTIVQRTLFILSLIVLFWILFIIIYISSRLILKFLSNLKRFHFHYDSPSTSNDKICRAFVISSHHYGSFRPTHVPSPLLYRSDSLFSNNEPILNDKQPIQTKTNNNSLLEHYLETYNPLKIDFKDETISTSDIKDLSYEQAQSDTDTRPITNCYAFTCTNKRKTHQGEQYTRLKEDNCSATMSAIDDRLSECSTKLTSTTLPILMVTDCSNSQRLHTDIIELDDDDDREDK
ncbi:unnamed protein product [Adineta steineri]|uniref:Uncharacterized protein n=1 Tax=Adineta steineri TaxID=433720 RepID=A0A819EHS1_9BILA|nr:unnamed protein product [Adineta steineri]CAF3594175.1 unnamed protein product [Adineta steineri]CAF3850206.1 unnamed protein product [Adineta steineri]